MNKALHYSDVYLIPKYSELTSRSKADVSVELGGKKFKLPVMPANMVACIDDKQAKWLSENGYFYVRHRFNIDDRGRSDNFEFCLKAQKENWKTISISIGVKEWDRIDIENLSGSFGHLGCEDATRVDYITIDVAHGHSKAVKSMISHIHSMYRHEKTRPFIIAGNVTTPEAVLDLAEWGADAIKVGIGGGGACSTKNKTGFHIPMFTAVRDCVCAASIALPIPQTIMSENGTGAIASHTVKRIPIIADGGIRENGDIAKALAAGAHMVMAGSIFAACEDSPAENVQESKHYSFETGPKTYYGKITHKKYFGSASAKNKGFAKHVEGLEIEIPCNGMKYADKLTEIEQDLQSAVSYAGGTDLKALRQVAIVHT